MTIASRHARKPGMQSVVDELSALIRSRYPEAQLQVHPHPEEPSTTLLEATVDLDDTEEVLDLVFDRMEQMRIDEGLPILVVPLQTPERVVALLAVAQAGQTA